MGILDLFKKGSKSSREPKLELIGQTEPICPYCEGVLDKKPGRKKKCSYCGNYIYVRTRPCDREKILIREDQIETIEKQWAIANGTYDEYLKERQRYEKERERLALELGWIPSDEDVKIGLCNQDLIEYSKTEHWGLYRNTKLELARIQEKQGKYRDAVNTFCEVCLLDINGPMNKGDNEFIAAWDPELCGGLVAGILCMLKRVANTVDITDDELIRIFESVTKPIYDSLTLPIPYTNAIKTFEDNI